MKILGMMALLGSLTVSSLAGATDLSTKDSRDGYADRKSWAGFYVGADVGYEASELSVEGTPLSLGGGGAFAAFRAGYDVQPGGRPLVFGAFGAIGTTELEYNAVDAEVDFFYEVGARAGIAIGNALPYVFAGYQWRDFGEVSNVDLNLDGWFGGAGIELALGGGFSTKIEGRYSLREEEVSAFGTKTDLEDDAVSATVGIVYKIN